MFRKKFPNNITFVEAFRIGKKQRPRSILLRITETTTDDGAALGMAVAWHRDVSSIPTCHYAVDLLRIINCVPDNRIARNGADTMKHTVSIGLCAYPTTYEGLWTADRDTNCVLENAAELVARLCITHKIPVRSLSSDELLKKRRSKGIATLIPGAWPEAYFLERVEYYKALFKQGKKEKV